MVEVKIIVGEKVIGKEKVIGSKNLIVKVIGKVRVGGVEIK